MGSIANFWIIIFISLIYGALGMTDRHMPQDGGNVKPQNHPYSYGCGGQIHNFE
jgi:hypothetical protein